MTKIQKQLSREKNNLLTNDAGIGHRQAKYKKWTWPKSYILFEINLKYISDLNVKHKTKIVLEKRT